MSIRPSFAPHFADLDDGIDFSAAGLYLVGLQTIVATCTCSFASILSCWVLPRAAISAVRTLAVTTFVGLVGVSQPLRIERVRGVELIFNALRPSIAIYILVLITEQLVHTCVMTDSRAGRWRRAIFHILMFMMMGAGFMRANRPTSEYDCSFILTSIAVVVIALLPPPASALSGPLCEPATLFVAGERMLRALFFSVLYVIHVYTAAPNKNTPSELVLCVLRAASAAVWVLGCHAIMLTLAPLQGVVALWRRFGHRKITTPPSYSPLSTFRDITGSPPPDAHRFAITDKEELPNGLDVSYTASPKTSGSDDALPSAHATTGPVSRPFVNLTFTDDRDDVAPGMPFSRSKLDELAAAL